MILFRLKQVIALKKVKQELFTKKENEETKSKRALENLRMSKVQEIFTTAAIVCHRYERLAVSQDVFAIIPL